jgi:hypothetical protein
MRTGGSPRLLAGAWLLGALACGSDGRNADGSPDAIAEPQQRATSLCAELGMTVSARAALPPSWNACTLALRATFAMIGDTATLQVLASRPLVPRAAEIQELAEKEFGATAVTKFTSVILRLPSASHDVEVRFSEAGAVTSVSAIHKPLQR